MVHFDDRLLPLGVEFDQLVTFDDMAGAIGMTNADNQIVQIVKQLIVKGPWVGGNVLGHAGCGEVAAITEDELPYFFHTGRQANRSE